MGAMQAARMQVTATQWRVLALLVVSIFINYIDRGALGVAAPKLREELALGADRIGLLLSAFFWTYAACQIIAGWLVHRYDVRWVFGLGFLIWTLAMFGTGLAHVFGTLFVLRLLLGLGESVAYPSYSRILAGGFPESHRGIANALIDAGSKAGPALGNLIGGLLVADYGWRTLFVVLGIGGLLWLPPWALWGPRDRTRGAIRGHAGGPGFVSILRQRAAWGTFLGLFGANYAWYFLLTWLPSYLISERHYSDRMMAVVSSLPFVVIAASSVFGGWISDRLIARGRTPTQVRKTMIVSGLLVVAGLIVPVAVVSGAGPSMAFLIAASLVFGCYSSNNWAATQTLAGPSVAGKWTGLQNALGNLGGVTAPYITGLVVHRTGSFLFAFVAVAAALCIGGLGYLILVRKVAPIDWEEAGL